MATVAHPSLEPSGITGIVLRDPRSADQGYITSTWLRSMRHASRYSGMPRARYFRVCGEQLDRLLDRSDTRCLVAADAGDLDSILGWAVYTPVDGAPVLHYAYTRKEHRRRGVMRALIRRVGFRREAFQFYTFVGPKLAVALHALGKCAPMSIEEFLR